MKKRNFAYAKTGFLPMRKQRRRSAVQISWIVYNFSSTYIQNFKFIVFFCNCTGLFVPKLVGNPKDRFSGIAAQIMHV